jgi:hypothetical protein
MRSHSPYLKVMVSSHKHLRIDLNELKIQDINLEELDSESTIKFIKFNAIRQIKRHELGGKFSKIPKSLIQD